MPSVGAVTSNLNIVTKDNVDYTALANEFVIMSVTDAARTVTLPAAPTINTIVAVKKTDASANAVQVVGSGSAKINGDSSGAVLPATGSSLTVQFDGTDWHMISSGMPNVANAVAGVPTGGSVNQVLKKNSATNYDVRVDHTQLRRRRDVQ